MKRLAIAVLVTALLPTLALAAGSSATVDPADARSPFSRPLPVQPAGQGAQPQVQAHQLGRPVVPTMTQDGSPGIKPVSDEPSLLPDPERKQLQETVSKLLGVLRVASDHAVFRLRDGAQESYPMYSNGDVMFLGGAEYTVKIVGATETQYRVQLVKAPGAKAKKGAKGVVFAEMWPESAPVAIGVSTPAVAPPTR